jgi:hypothetical protein
MQILKPFIVELAPTLSQHWYNVWKQKLDGKKGRFLGTFPSATTVLNAYPQSPQLTQWIAENGWNESQRIKESKGRSGTLIHAACDALEGGAMLNNEDYSLEEWWKISTFVAWFDETQPEPVASEFPIFSPSGKYAGRLDRIYRINGEITLLDFKSSSSLHAHFPLQFASYAHAIEETTDLKIVQTAALQLGAKNKNGYRYVLYPEWQEHYKVFKSVKETWYYDNFGSRQTPKEPPVLVLPETLKLNLLK